jgi:hypothetical protein
VRDGEIVKQALAIVAGLGLGACAPRAMSVTPDHPANPEAPIGRLAGPPPAGRPGVARTTEPAKPVEPDGHQGHDAHSHHQGHH